MHAPGSAEPGACLQVFVKPFAADPKFTINVISPRELFRNETPNRDDSKMEALELFFKGLFVSAYDSDGVVGALCVVLVLLGLIFLLAILKAIWMYRAELLAWVVSKFKDNPRLRIATVGFLTTLIFAAIFLPSSPWVVGLLVVGCVILLVKNIRIRLANAKFLHKFAFGVLLCFGLTVGGIFHDVAFPPTALCRDGTYSDSSHHSGTCSWHGGVWQWNPTPWWQEVFM
jgi:hypothetical protein